VLWGPGSYQLVPLPIIDPAISLRGVSRGQCQVDLLASFYISYLAKKPHYGGRISYGRASDGRVSHGRIPHGRVSYECASHKRASHERASHGRISHVHAFHEDTLHKRVFL